MPEPVDHSETQICNRALQKLGAAPIASLTDGSRSAEACNYAYYDVRDAMLEAHPWKFAIAQAAIAADNTPPDGNFGRTNSFTLPADFFRMIRPFPEKDKITLDWIIQEGKIYTKDVSPLYLRYIQKVIDPNKFTPLFREALACAVAYEICETITQSNTKKATINQDRAVLIAEAKRTQAIEKMPEEQPDDYWLLVRL